jgi:hypothetical protein
MKLLSVFCLSLCSLFAAAQEPDSAIAEPAEPKPSKISRAYHEYRMQEAAPCYPTATVKAAVKKQVKRDEEENLAMNAAAYKKLSLQEKFVYAMIHPETFSQICDALRPIAEEHKKIFGQIPDTYSDYVWSERQLNFLKSNRDTVMQMAKTCIAQNKRVGVNYKTLLIRINAVEMIPFLIELYNVQKKDYDILTVLMQLMKAAKYQPFTGSAAYKKLYGADSDYYSFINAGKANIDLIIKRAMEFYNSRQK